MGVEVDHSSLAREDAQKELSAKQTRFEGLKLDRLTGDLNLPTELEWHRATFRCWNRPRCTEGTNDTT